MKTLELNQMNGIEGGAFKRGDCLGLAVGVAAGFLVATILTGGAFAGLAIASIGSLGSGAFCQSVKRAEMMDTTNDYSEIN